MRNKGFTLVEILISITILTMVMAGCLTTVIAFQRSMTGLGNYSIMNQQSAIVLEVLGRDVRMGRYITLATDTEMEIVRSTISNPITVKYTYDASVGELSRELNGQSNILITNITDFTFKYYNVLEVETAHLREIQKIQILTKMKHNILNIKQTDNIVSAEYAMRDRSLPPK